MDFSAFFKSAGAKAAANSPAILTAIGVAGTVATAYLAARAGFVSVEPLNKATEEKIEANRDLSDLPEDEAAVIAVDPNRFELTFKEKAGTVWKLYIPAAITLSVTVGAIIFSNRISDRRAAAVASAYKVMEHGFNEYRKKTTQKVGKTKEQAIRDEIAQEQFKKNPPTGKTVVFESKGTTWFRDAWSGRYFRSDWETVRKAVNDFNHGLNNSTHSPLSEFYHLIGLAPTQNSEEVGWDSGTQLEIEHTAMIGENNEPCISIAFKNPPSVTYGYLH